MRKKLTTMPGLRQHQDGERFGCWEFDVSLLPQVAEIVGAKRRRRMTEEQRRVCAERLREYQFRSTQPCDCNAPLEE